MTAARVIKELKDVNISEDIYFEWGHRLFSQNEFVRTFMEKVFNTDISVCYMDKRVSPSKVKLCWSAATIILFLKNGNIVELKNSEWAHMELHSK